MRDDRWFAEIQDTGRQYFDLDWKPNMQRINADYNIANISEHELMTVAPGLPPAWFNGNIAGVREDDWILVVSHNPHINHKDEETKAWYLAQGFDADRWWNYWSEFNLNSPHRNANFTRPLARLAARAIDETDTGSDYFRFAYERMIFIDICPYASNKWGLNNKKTRQLMDADDPGIQFSKRILKILIDRGRPRLVLVQGGVVLKEFATVMAEHLHWASSERYPSLVPPKEGNRLKSYWNLEGHIATGDVTIPAFGFPKMGGRNGRQANLDIDYLGDRMKDFAARI